MEIPSKAAEVPTEQEPTVHLEPASRLDGTSDQLLGVDTLASRLLEEVEQEDCLTIEDGVDLSELRVDESKTEIEDLEADLDVTRMPGPTTSVAAPEREPEEPVVLTKEDTLLTGVGLPEAAETGPSMQPNPLTIPLGSEPAVVSRHTTKVPKLDLAHMAARRESRGPNQAAAPQNRAARRSVAVAAARYAPRRPTLLAEAPVLEQELMRRMEAGGQNLRPSVLVLDAANKVSVKDIP